MADDNAVVIKIAADVSLAATALELMVEGMADLITATNNVAKAFESSHKTIGDSSKKAKTETEGFWTSFLHGVTGAQVGAVAMGTQMSKAFDKIGEGVREAVTAFPNMVKHVAEAGDEMLTLSNRIGVSVEDLGELKYIAGQSGADMQGLARTIQGLNGTFNESGEKGQKARDALKGIGLSVEDLKKQDPKAAFFEIIKGIQGTVPAADQGRVAMEIFGQRFRNNTMILKEDIGALQSKFKELGGGMTTELAKAGDEYSDNIKNIEQVQENFRAQIAGAVLPAVNSMLEAFPQLGGLVLSLGENILDLAKSFGPMIIQLIASKMAFAETAVAAEATAAAETEAAVATTGLAAAIDFLMGPVGWLLAALGLLVGAFLLFGKSESESEKQSRAHAVAFKQQTDSLEESLKTYDELHGKLKLNTDETAKLETATLALAKASGISAEAFKTNAGAAELALKHLRELLAGDKQLLAVAIERARKEQEEAKYQLERAQAEKTAITEKHEVVGPNWRGVPVTMKVSAEQALDAFTKQDAKVTELQAKLDGLTHTYEVLTGTEKAAVPVVADHTDKLTAHTKAIQDLLKGTVAENKARIEGALASGISSQKIAEDMGFADQAAKDLASAIDLYKKSLENAKKASEHTPFAKLAEEAKNLSAKFTEAHDAGIAFATTMATDGKKAADLIKEFAERGALDKLPQNIKDTGTAWVEADLAEKMRAVTKTTEEMARSWKEDATTGAQAAADATKKMAQEMAMSFMSTEEAAHQAIVNEETERAAALDRQSDNLQKKLVADNLKITEAYAARRKNEIEAAQALGQQVSAAQQDQTNADEAAARVAAANSVVIQQDGLDKERAQLIAFYEHKLAAQEHNLADGEANLKTWGDKVKSAAEKEIADQKKHIEALKAMNDPYYAEQIRHLEDLVAANERALDAIEVSAAAHGVKTTSVKKKEFNDQLKFQLDMADSIARNEGKYNAEDLKAQQAKTDAASQAMDEKTQMADRLGAKTNKQLNDEVKSAKMHLAEMKADRDTWGNAAIAKQEEIVVAAEKAAGKTSGVYQAMGDKISGVFQTFAAKGNAYMQQLGSAMGQASQAASGMKSAKEAWKKPGATKTDKAGAAMDMGMAGIEGAQAVWAATDTLSTKKNVLGGAMAGAKAGSAFGPWGTAVGAGVGAIVGAFRNKGAMRAAKQAAGDFGAEIPIDVAKGIEKEAKKSFGGDRLPAEMLHFGEILEAAGGVTDKNVVKMTARMGDAINLTKQGKLTVEQTTKILDDSFGAFAKHTLESGKIADKGFTDMIKGAEGLGIKSKEIADFVGSQVDRLGNAFAVMISPLAKQAGDIGAQVAAQKQKLDDAKKSTEGKDITEEQQKALDNESATYDLLITKQKSMAEDSLPKINRAARLMTATFNEAVASGMSMTEAVDRMGPGLDSLIQTTKDLGMTVEDTSAGFLASFRDRVNANRELVDGAASLNDIMLAMSNIGALNKDTFLDLQAQGLETYDQLDKAGFDQNEILSQMKPFLEQARDAHENLKLPIDENTEALIKQAEEHGILKKQAVDTNTVLMEGFGALIEAVGGKLPDAFKKMKDAALEASQKAAAGMKGVDGAATGVQSSLNSTDWAGWSADAVNAATEAQKAVDAVSLGHSPGGIKEIPIQLTKATKAFNWWSHAAVGSAKTVETAVNDIRPDKTKLTDSPADSVSMIRAVSESIQATADAMDQMKQATDAMQPIADAVQPMTEAVQAMGPIAEDVKATIDAGMSQDQVMQAQKALQMATYEQERQRQEAAAAQTQNVEISIDRPILKDRDSMQDLAVSVAKHLKRALNPFGAWR